MEEQVARIYEQMTERGYDKQNKYNFCDGDITAWVIPTPHQKYWKVLAIRTQNFNFLNFYRAPKYPGDAPEMHVRTYQDAGAKEEGLTMADYIATQFVPLSGTSCPGIMYGDIRDVGYVFSIRNINAEQITDVVMPGIALDELAYLGDMLEEDYKEFQYRMDQLQCARPGIVAACQIERTDMFRLEVFQPDLSQTRNQVLVDNLGILGDCLGAFRYFLAR